MEDIRTYDSVVAAEDKIAKLCNYLERNYLENLNEKFIQPVPREICESEFSSIRILKFGKIIFDKNEDNLVKILNIYKSLYNVGAGFFIILDAKKEYVSYYMGIKTKNGKFSLSSFEILKKGFKGNFPGINYDENFNDEKIEKIMMGVTEGVEVSAVTQIPSHKIKDSKNNNLEFVQGIEKFIEGMRGRG